MILSPEAVNDINAQVSRPLGTFHEFVILPTTLDARECEKCQDRQVPRLLTLLASMAYLFPIDYNHADVMPGPLKYTLICIACSSPL